MRAQTSRSVSRRTRRCSGRCGRVLVDVEEPRDGDERAGLIPDLAFSLRPSSSIRYPSTVISISDSSVRCSRLDRSKSARAVLALDAVGCGVAAVVAASFPAVTRPVNALVRARWRIASTLALTSVLCAHGARAPQPSSVDLTVASALNGAWVATCLIALPRQDRRLGRVLVATTAACDGVVGSVQWALRPRQKLSP